VYTLLDFALLDDVMVVVDALIETLLSN